jgi:hypothetical protein
MSSLYPGDCIQVGGYTFRLGTVNTLELLEPREIKRHYTETELSLAKTVFKAVGFDKKIAAIKIIVQSIKTFCPSYTEDNLINWAKRLLEIAEIIIKMEDQS